MGGNVEGASTTTEKERVAFYKSIAYWCLSSVFISHIHIF